MRAACALVLALLAALVAVPGQGSAQSVGVVQSDLLVLDPDRLFSETRLGQRINAEFLAEREALIARNRQIEAELEAEELALTELRAETSPEEFRDLADTFDAKVQQIRRDSDQAVRELERSRERAPVTFMRLIQPVLVEVMRETGGVAIIDIRNVLLSADVIDITDLAIARVDAEIGSGGGALPQPPETPLPEPQTTTPQE